MTSAYEDETTSTRKKGFVAEPVPINLCLLVNGQRSTIAHLQFWWCACCVYYVIIYHCFLLPQVPSFAFRSFGSIILTQKSTNLHHFACHRTTPEVVSCWPNGDWKIWKTLQHVLQKNRERHVLGQWFLPSELERCKSYGTKSMWADSWAAKWCKYEVQIAPELIWINISIPLSRLIPHFSFRTWANCGF